MGEGRRMAREQAHRNGKTPLNGAALLPNPAASVRKRMQHVPLDITQPISVVVSGPGGVDVDIIGGTPHLVAMATAIAPGLPDAEPEFIAERAAAILDACHAKMHPPVPEEPAQEETKSPIIAG